MATPVPFQPKPDKKGRKQPWFALIPGKGLTNVAPPDTPEDEVKNRISDMMKSIAESIPPEKTAKNSTDSTSTISLTDSSAKDSIDAGKPEKPKPGAVNQSGLARLSPERLKVLREKIASALSSGNISVDRMLVSIFRDNVPILTPDSYLLLTAGWELACEQYFVSGIVPPWLLIVLGNIQVTVAMVELSKPKKVEEPVGDKSIESLPKSVDK